MPMEPDLIEMMNDTVVVYPFVSYSAHGAPSYSGTGTTHPVRFENRFQMIKGSDGRDIVARGKLILGPSSTGGLPRMTVQSKVVDISTTAGYKLLWVQEQPDQDGDYYVAAYFG